MRTVIVFVAGLLLVSTVEAASLSKRVKALERKVTTLEKTIAELIGRVESLEEGLPGAETPTSPYIVDSTGQVVGVMMDQVTVFNPLDGSGNDTALLDAAVMIRIEGLATVVRVTPGAITGFLSPREGSGTAPLNFDGADCTGTPYITAVPAATFGGRALLFGNNLYIPKPEPGVFARMVSRVRQAGDGTLFCDTPQPGSLPNTYVEALTVPVSIFNKFTPPFSLVDLPNLP